MIGGTGASTVGGEPELVIVEDGAAAASLAAARISRRLREAAEGRGRADWATTGGSAPVGIYRALRRTPLREQTPWHRVHTWWGDDRFVRRMDPHSNVRPFDETLLGDASAVEGDGSPPDIPADHIHPFPIDAAIDAGRSEADCAAALATELRAADLPQADGWPVLDLILLGVGGDGHILSVFPESPALTSMAWALDIPAPDHIEPRVERVTLNPALVTVARHVLVVVLGSAKADILATILGSVRDPVRWPAQLARSDRATWIVDRAAAARIDR